MRPFWLSRLVFFTALFTDASDQRSDDALCVFRVPHPTFFRRMPCFCKRSYPIHVFFPESDYNLSSVHKHLFLFFNLPFIILDSFIYTKSLHNRLCGCDRVYDVRYKHAEYGKYKRDNSNGSHGVLRVYILRFCE